ncbi:MAG: hypothetical protein FWG05_06450, partial [Kiritimatiellaeota bacterium]|nr:hypothetical protein [Kiritimatiellota bacterium]
MTRISRILFFVAAAAMSAANATATPLEKVFAKDGVRAEVSVNPAVVNPAVDNEVAITLTAPRGAAPSIPADMSDRFEGFVIEDEFTVSRPTDLTEETTRNFKLRPVPGAKIHRIRPFAVTYSDASSNPPVKHWFATEMIVLKKTESGAGGGVVSENLQARRIAPSYKDVPKYAAFALGAAAVITALAFAFSRIRLARKIRMMTPGERA